MQFIPYVEYISVEIEKGGSYTETRIVNDSYSRMTSEACILAC
jgi:hypothetical protein